MSVIQVENNPTPTTYRSAIPYEDRRVGAAAIYCSDGRYGEQVDEFLHQGLGLPRYDRLALPGGAGCLAGHVAAHHDRVALERQLAFLIQAHALRRVVLIAHEGCGFYKDIWTAGRTIEQLQTADLQRASEQIRLWNTGVQVETYFASKCDGRVVFERR